MSGENEASIMENLRKYDGDMAEKIMDEMFVFDNILEIDDRGIQLLLREVQSDSLIVALKGANADMREKSSEYVSACRRDDARRSGIKGPVRLSEVEAQQNKS